MTSKQAWITKILITKNVSSFTGDNKFYPLNLPLYAPDSTKTKLIRSTIHYAYINLNSLYINIGSGTATYTIDDIYTSSGTRYIPMGNIFYNVHQ